MNEQQYVGETVTEACARCGRPLGEAKGVDGIVASIKDNYGVYHSACWGAAVGYLSSTRGAGTPGECGRPG